MIMGIMLLVVKLDFFIQTFVGKCKVEVMIEEHWTLLWTILLYQCYIIEYRLLSCFMGSHSVFCTDNFGSNLIRIVMALQQSWHCFLVTKSHQYDLETLHYNPRNCCFGVLEHSQVWMVKQWFYVIISTNHL